MTNAYLKEQFDFNLKLYQQTKQLHLGLDLIEESQLEFLEELDEESTSIVSSLCYALMQQPTSAIAVCIRRSSEAGKSFDALMRYLDKILEEYLQLSKRMLSVLTGVVLDKA